MNFSKRRKPMEMSELTGHEKLYYCIFGHPNYEYPYKHFLSQEEVVIIDEELARVIHQHYENPKRNLEIIRFRFGLNGDKTKTLAQCGEKFGLTRERIRQIETRVLRLIRYSSDRISVNREKAYGKINEPI
jgi:hypothetical protein